MRLLVTSSRNFVFPTIIRKAVLRVERELGDPWALSHKNVLAHGAARGGDIITAGIVKELGWTTQPYKVTSAQWRASRGAGYARNAEMVEDGADFFLAFLMPCSDVKCKFNYPHESHGATHCLELARKAGIPRRVYRFSLRERERSWK